MLMAEDILNIHAILPVSRANGPGKRFAIWFQGCSLACPGCFNPDTHSHAPRHLMSVDDVFQQVSDNVPVVEGISISGGEPFQQPAPLLSLFKRLRDRTTLSILVFSGYTLDRIKKIPCGTPLLQMIDVLVDGPYVKRLRLSESICGSDNQRIHLLTGRYSMDNLVQIPRAEIQIDSRGTLHMSGFSTELLNRI